MLNLEQAIEKSKIAYNLQGGVILYFTRGILPGSFLTACLENDLKMAMGMASTQTWDYIYNVVQFLYQYAPSNSWGSKEKVKAFLESFQRLDVSTSKGD